jgi:putative addiction module component (TIGR02574 family)
MAMLPELRLSEMTVAEKLALMDALWDDLSRNAEELPTPAWHCEVLVKREEEIANGTARFIPLEEMEARLRRELP